MAILKNKLLFLEGQVLKSVSIDANDPSLTQQAKEVTTSGLNYNDLYYSIDVVKGECLVINVHKTKLRDFV